MNMKQSCKALICAIEGELDGRHCTEEQAAAILDHALPSLTEALALAEAERDRYKAAWMEFMDRTDWMQEKGQVPAKYLGQHRADALTAMLNEARAAIATQPAVPASVEAMSFEYTHLSGERRTVSITREDVIEGMDDALYEKLSDQICRCEPIGETNVVECNCQDYVEEFALVSAKPAVRGAEHGQ